MKNSGQTQGKLRVRFQYVEIVRGPQVFRLLKDFFGDALSDFVSSPSEYVVGFDEYRAWNRWDSANDHEIKFHSFSSKRYSRLPAC
jgi:hypothetical protein